MKIYFPDDPIKQEMLEALIKLSQKICEEHYDVSLSLNNCQCSMCFSARQAVYLIEKATNQKIEEVLG